MTAYPIRAHRPEQKPTPVEKLVIWKQMYDAVLAEITGSGGPISSVAREIAAQVAARLCQGVRTDAD